MADSFLSGHNAYLSTAGGCVMRNISIHTDEGMYILFRGPFPQILKDLADGRYRLDNHTDFVVPWLNREWPEWRQHIVRSENVPLPGERMPRRRS